MTVLEVRLLEEYASGHLPATVNVPLSDLERKLKDLAEDREIVAYCRGAYGVLAYEAIARLRKRGIKARCLQNGFPEWQAAGFPVERAG